MTYSYEAIKARGSDASFRVRDGNDNRVATCYVEENAKLVVHALNNEAQPDGELARLRKENTYLRGLVQCLPVWKCTYGYLDAEKKPLKAMGLCPLGFPGCGCADDLMCAGDPDEFSRPKINWHSPDQKPAKVGQYLCRLPYNQFAVCSYKTSHVSGQAQWSHADIAGWAEIPA